jgi:hypothetical protein
MVFRRQPRDRKAAHPDTLHSDLRYSTLRSTVSNPSAWRSLRYLVMDRRIRSHLDTSLAARPILCSSQEFRSNPLPPPVLRDVPTLHVTDGIACLASIGVRAQTGFQKSCQCPITCLCNQNHPGMTPGNCAPRINRSSCPCSPAEDSGHSIALNRANWSRSDSWANLTCVSLTQQS